MSRKNIIIANWKMYKTNSEAESFVKRFNEEIEEVKGIDIVICPSFIALPALSKIMEPTYLSLGAQNMHWEKEGAYTGEVSPLMLREIGVKYVILGHSERRSYFGEGEEYISKKVAAAAEFGLIPIVCVGENYEQRSAGQTEEVIKRQLSPVLERLNETKDFLKKIVLAYEPVWAIGTGVSAYGEDADDAAGLIRGLVREKWGEEVSQGIRIVYGGSVKPENILSFTSKPHIDGALVGGSSLKEKMFGDIIRAVLEERRG